MKRASLAILLLLLGVAGLFLLARGLEVRPEEPVAPGARMAPEPGGESARRGPPPDDRSVRFTRRGPPILGFQERPFPFLADEDDRGSVSVGTVTEGYLVNAVEVTVPGEHYGILPIQLLRGLRFTTDEMAALLRHAADEVAAEYPGTVLWVGNLSRRGGGDIPWSVSHNSGRDADVAFFFDDDEGNPVAPPDLIPVSRQLTFEYQGTVYHFDVARSWSLVRALLSYEPVQVQFLFIANFLKDALLRHAREQGEPAALIRRAETVMSQPGRSNPHDDHLHVRLYCSRTDVGAGCENLGRVHPWIDTYAEVRPRRVREVREFLEDEEAEQRARAIERLVILESREDVPRFVPLLADESSRVRAAAARGLEWGGTPAALPALVEAFEGETDGEVLIALIDAIGTIDGATADTYLVQHLAEPLPVVVRGTELDLRAVIVDALAEQPSAVLAPTFVGVLDADDAYLRARAAWALARLTNQRVGDGWEDPRLDRETQAAGHEAWLTWLEAHVTEPRDSWLVDGFRAAGVSVLDGGLDLTSLVEAVSSARDYVRYNAQRALMSLLERDVPSLGWPTSDAAWYWQDALAGLAQ